MACLLTPGDVSTLSNPGMTSLEFQSTKNYVNQALERDFHRLLQPYEIESGLEAIDPDGESIKLLQLKLQMEGTSSDLGAEIQDLKGTFNQALNFKQWERQFRRKNMHVERNRLRAPENTWSSSSNTEQQYELVDKKASMRSIPTVSTLELIGSMAKEGRYEPEAVAQEVVKRIQTLSWENQQINEMLEYGKAKEMQILLQLSHLKNKKLEERIPN